MALLLGAALLPRRSVTPATRRVQLPGGSVELLVRPSAQLAVLLHLAYKNAPEPHYSDLPLEGFYSVALACSVSGGRLGRDGLRVQLAKFRRAQDAFVAALIEEKKIGVRGCCLGRLACGPPHHGPLRPAGGQAAAVTRGAELQ